MEREHDMHVLENDRIRMVFDPGGRLAELRAVQGQAYAPIDQKALTAPWALDLRGAQGELTRVMPSSDPRIEVRTRGGAQELEAVWSADAAGGTLTVTGTVRLEPGSPLAAWTLGVDNPTDTSLWTVLYPRVSALTAYPDVDGPDALATPQGMGEWVPAPVDKVNHHRKQVSQVTRQEYGKFDVEGGGAIALSYPGKWTMQFVAYGHPQVGGVYFGAHDGAALYKRFGMYADGADGDHAALMLKQYPEDRLARGGTFHSFYPVMVGLYEGDWWNASALYRAWALQQPWAARGPTREREDIPAWAKELDAWWWNHKFPESSHPRYIVPAVRYFKEQTGAEMAVHWYSCNAEHFETNWRIPEVYPENEDIRDQLVQGVRELHAMNVRCIPYVQGRAWHPHLRASKEQNFMQCIVRDEHGEPADPRASNRQTLCPTEAPNHDRLRRIVLEMVDGCEMDGAYLDVISCNFAVPCFDPNHDHPPGGHDHWCRGYREMVRKVREAIRERSPDTFLTSESVIECFLDLFDLDLARELNLLRGHTGLPDAMPIPFFHSVYHDYHMTYGTLTNFKQRNLDHFRYADALCLVGGQQLMLAAFFPGDWDKDKFRPHTEYMLMLARAHVAARTWLNLGEWRPPAPVRCARIDIPLEGEGSRPQQPAVLSGCFVLDGTLCAVLVNHTATEQPACVTVDPALYGIETPCTLRAIHPHEEMLAQGVTEALDHERTLPPRTAEVWLLSPDA